MLPKSRRLSRLDLHRHNLRSPSPTPLGRAYLVPGSGKAAIITSSRLSKRAVVRNRLRRRFYTALSPLSFTNFDLVLYPSPSTLNLSLPQLTSLLTQLLTSTPSSRP